MLAGARRGRARVYSTAWKVAVVVWALAIFFLSTAAFGLSFTGRLLAGALSFLHLRLPAPSFEVLHHWCARPLTWPSTPSLPSCFARHRNSSPSTRAGGGSWGAS